MHNSAQQCKLAHWLQTTRDIDEVKLGYAFNPEPCVGEECCFGKISTSLVSEREFNDLIAL